MHQSATAIAKRVEFFALRVEKLHRCAPVVSSFFCVRACVSTWCGLLSVGAARPIPVLGVFGIIYYIYHVFVFEFSGERGRRRWREKRRLTFALFCAAQYIDRRGSDVGITVCLAVFHVLIALVLLSYLRAVFTMPPEVVRCARVAFRSAWRASPRRRCASNAASVARAKVYHLPDDVHVDGNGQPRRSTETYW